MRMGAAHVIIMSAILVSVMGTFFAANTITGLTTASDTLSKGDFAAVTGKMVAETALQQASGLGKAAGSILLGLASITALVVVARIGQNAMKNAVENAEPGIKDNVRKAEGAIKEGNYTEAHALYNAIREQYAKLQEQEKAQHHSRIIQLHSSLLRQATMAEAHYLTEKYVNNTITEEEFERLKQIVVNQ